MAAVATKTNERPGTRAQMRYARFSASKARAVLDLIRGLPVNEAAEVLQFTERGPSPGGGAGGGGGPPRAPPRPRGGGGGGGRRGGGGGDGGGGGADRRDGR